MLSSTSQGQGPSASSWNSGGRQIYWREEKRKRKTFPWQTKNLWFLSSSSETEMLRLYLRLPPRLTSGELAACGDWEWGRKQAVDSVVTRCREKRHGQIYLDPRNSCPFCSLYIFHFQDHLRKTPTLSDRSVSVPWHAHIYRRHFTLLHGHARKESQTRHFSPLVIDERLKAQREGDVYSWWVVDLALEFTIATSSLQGSLHPSSSQVQRMGYSLL